MNSLSLEKVYLWKKDSVYTYPWQRQFLNIDFLKYEKKRIKDVGDWYNKFIKLSLGENLPEVYYYVIPARLNSDWKASIVVKGSYNYFCVSALKNSPQLPLLVLIPKDCVVPQDYSLIRIVKSKKDEIFNIKSNKVIYVVNATSIDDVDSSLPFVDVPFIRKSVLKFIKENIVKDDLVASSFQPTISSSPYVLNGKGGVSFSVFGGVTQFSDELITTLKLMQPPDFSDVYLQLSDKVLGGVDYSEPGLGGIKFHIAERSVVGKNFFSAFSGFDYKRLDFELMKRYLFKGEYSIACSLTPRGESSELLRDILSKFVKTEVTHPFYTDELVWDYIDLTKAQKNIDEDLWLQIANQRQLTPANIDKDDIGKLREQLIIEWKIILETFGLKKTEYESKVYSKASFDNILRVAQSVARDGGSNKIDKFVLSKSYDIFARNVEKLTNNPKIKYYIKSLVPEQRENEKFNAIRSELSVNILDIQELFECVGEFFSDIYELQKVIDKLQQGGYLYEPSQGHYRWI